MNRRYSEACRGFSLIEMIIAISVLGILGAAAAVFLRGPFASYFATERRADLANAAELALAKMSREIARAVPNSVRVTDADGFYIEFLPVRSEGRYRIGPPGDPLDFAADDDGFDVLGPRVQVNAGDWVVVNNYLAGPDNDVWVGGANPPAGTPRALTASSGLLARIENVAHRFIADSPDHRFQIAGATPVTYVCDPAAGSLRRYSGYPLQAAQPVDAADAPLADAQNNLLATRLTACRAAQFPGNLRRAQRVSLSLTFAEAGDLLTLAHTIRVEPLP